jgi:hypothetical protein
MKLIRKSTNETVPLEDGFLWSDEFDWKPIEQTQERAVDGTLIIQEGKKKSGRPISLQPAADGMGWVKRSVLSTLKNWSAIQGEEFILKFEYGSDQRQFNVIFNHTENAIEAKPVKGIPAASENEFYSVTMRFTELSDAN